MAIGLIQIIVCRFGNIEPARQLMDELIKLEGEGNIRVVDALFVTKDAAGNLNSMEMSGFNPSEQIKFGSVINTLIRAGTTGDKMELARSGSGAWAEAGHSYGMSAADVQEITGRLAPDDAAGFFLIEHIWTSGFLDTLAQIGGQMIAQGFLNRQALLMIEGEIESRVEALGSIKKSEEDQRKTAMDALISAATSRAMQEETSLRAAEMLVEEKIIEGEAMDDAARIVAAAMRIEEALNEESTSW